MGTSEITKPVEVFSGTAWQAEVIKSMLLDNDIQAFLGDEIWGMDAPIKKTPDMAGAVSVFVESENVEDAKIVVERYYEDDMMNDEGL